jgi:adhesin transport system outer membrane protein
MKFKRSILFCAVSGVLLASQYASALTLSEAVDRTIKTSPDVLIDAARRQAVDEEVKQAKGGYLPRVDLNAGYGIEWSDNTSTAPGTRDMSRHEAGLTLSQMIYDGFGVKSEVDRQTARSQSAAYKVAGISEDIARLAVEKYLEVLRRQELRDLTQKNLDVHKTTYEQIKMRADSGVGRKADMEQAMARLALAQANMASADANLREANIQFLKVVGAPAANLSKPDELSCELLPVSLDDAVSVAVANNPTLRSANEDIEAARAQTRAAQSQLKPRFDLEMGTNWNNDIDGVNYKDNDAYAMFRARYNLYRGGIDEARVAQRRVQEMEAAEVRNRTRRELEESTRLSWNALQTARERLPSQKEHAEAAAQTRDAYQKQFNIGQRTLLDLLDSENELYTARSEYVSGLYLETFARYRLLADVGTLVSTLGVAPRPEAAVMAGNASTLPAESKPAAQ